MLVEIKDVTPHFWGYDDFPRDSKGNIILPRVQYEVHGKMRNVIVIHRKNTVDYGNGLIGLLDGSKISNEDWVDLRKCFILEEEDGTQNFHWCIGGSDAGGICQCSPYANQRTVYETKTSDLNAQPDNETQYLFDFGHTFEELIARGFATRYKKKVVKNNTVFFREDIGFMQANVDFLVDGLDEQGNQAWYILEIKSTSPNSNVLRDYYKADKPSVPAYYYTQVNHYCAVLGAGFNIQGFYFAIGYDNIMDHIIGIKYGVRDINCEKTVLEMEYEFESCLRYRNPTGFTDGLISNTKVKEILKEKYPVSVEKKTTGISENAIALVKRLNELTEEQKERKRDLDELTNEAERIKCALIEEMKDCELTEDFDLNGQTYYLSLKNSTRETVDTKVLKDKYPKIFEEVKRESTSRRLTTKKRKAVKKK